jgi:DNA-binding GntR family transcriptional regulator
VKQPTSKSAVPKLTQTERAYTVLKRAILQGEITEGAFLSEAEIMSDYGIGRTPFREACNRLNREGLLDVIPRHGYLVPEISFRSVCDLFETRLILEMAIAELAAVRASDQDIEELNQLARKPLPAKASKGSFAAVIHANADFHLRLAKATRNRELVDLLTRNLEKTERLQYIELQFSRSMDKEFRMQHSRIVTALQKRDPQAVREAVLDDIREAQQATLNFGKWLPSMTEALSAQSA